MKSGIKEFRVKAGDAVDLKAWPTKIDAPYATKAEYKKSLAEHVDKLSNLQEILFASHSNALLVIFQAMDKIGRAHV